MITDMAKRTAKPKHKGRVFSPQPEASDYHKHDTEEVNYGERIQGQGQQRPVEEVTAGIVHGRETAHAHQRQEA